ncbi:hypothetical protein EYF80_030164 [Liparis tanakae]|uniref:Uncharacterized protein n=1 Tax=Liparis tanakae TaxID=230148 RepID=A0A4Z2H3X8_9TELE|nr:hypothetical protein EYF80_030164 [Liparis tanakae]
MLVVQILCSESLVVSPTRSAAIRITGPIVQLRQVAKNKPGTARWTLHQFMCYCRCVALAGGESFFLFIPFDCESAAASRRTSP